jgi:hypothetical protein
MIAQADKEPDLKPLAQSGPWKIYEVANSELVTPLATQPVVANGSSASRDSWLELGTSWFQNQSAWAAVPAASGPANWQRVDLAKNGKTDAHTLATVSPASPIQAEPLPAVTVSDIKTGDDTISFHVDKVGVPVMVKTGYFPNWKVSGAQGPYRSAPNYMIVVPTKNDVTLTYGYTGSDYLAYYLTFLGIVGVFVLWRRGRINYDDPSVAIPAAATTGATAASWAPPAREPLGLLMDWDDEPPPEPPVATRGTREPVPPAEPPPDQ